jgi:hypothetical protein
LAPVEQVKLKRAGIGLRPLDRERARPGFPLFAPQSSGGNVYPIDLDGKIFSTRQILCPPGHDGYLTERGGLQDLKTRKTEGAEERCDTGKHEVVK